MILVIGYSSKKQLKDHIGDPLDYQETSKFGPEYKSTGTFCVAHRPSITNLPGREFFAEVTMRHDVIVKVS